MTPPTYPARPINGGSWEHALPKSGEWDYEPKYNGWRTLVHIPTGEMFNRKGKPLTIAVEFKRALDVLAVLWRLHCPAVMWADCEALERRHGIGRGCLIVLDVIPSPGYTTPYRDRRSWLSAHLPETSILPGEDGASFPLVSMPPMICGSMETWLDLQRINKVLKCSFYEGMVAKRNLPYPIQLRSPDETTTTWMKHRWEF